MSGANETVFELTAKDQVSPVLAGVINSIGKLESSMKGGDKGLQQLQKSMVQAGQKAGVFSDKQTQAAQAAQRNSQMMVKGEQAYAAMLQGSSPAQREYIKNLETIRRLSSQKTGETTTTANGSVIGAGGKFLSNDQKQQLNAAKEANVGLKQTIDNTARAEAAAQKLSQAMQNVPPPSMRYALYDVSNSLAIVGAALVAGGVAAFKFAVEFQDAFADVERTVSEDGLRGGFSGLRDDLVDLSQIMPVAFTELARIASLGGQMGIDSSGIQQFTTVVAKMATVTDLSIDSAATAFGRFKAIMRIPESQFEALGSSVLKVGVNSVATEGQIVNIATQIVSMADFAGFTADQVVGLSGALASIGAPPELSRGVITRVFTKMSKAAGEGGAALTGFAKISGVSSDQFLKAWGTSAFSEVFVGFLDGIRTSGAGAVGALAELGITSVRDVPLLMRLAGAGNSVGEAGQLIRQTMDDAAIGWERATELSAQYGKRTETVSNKLKMLGNTIQTVFAALGDASLGPAAGFLDFLTGTLRAIENLLDTPVLGFIVSLVVGFTALMGVIALVGALVTRSAAGYIGLQNVMGGMIGTSGLVSASFVRMAGAFTMASGAGAKASVVFRGVGTALYAALGPVGIALAALTAITMGMPELANAFSKFGGRADGAEAAIVRLSKAGGSVGGWDLSKNIQSLNEYMDNPKWSRDLDRGVMNIWGDWDPGSVMKDIKTVDDSIAGFLSSGNIQGANFMLSEFLKINPMGKKDLLETFDEVETGLEKYGIQLKKGEDGNLEFSYAVDGVNGALSAETQELEAAQASFEKYVEVVAKGAMEFVKTGDLIKGQQSKRTEAAKAQIAEEIEAAKERGDTEAEAALKADDAWTKHYDGRSINLDTYLADQDAAIAEQQKWQDNMLKLSEMGFSEAFLTDLARLGPESAPYIEALLTGSKEQLDRVKENFEKAGMDSAMAFGLALAINTETVKTAALNVGKAGGAETQAAFVEEVAAGRIPFKDLLAKYGMDALGNPIKIWSDDGPAKAGVGNYLQWVRDQTGVVSVHVNIANRGAVDSYLGSMGFSTSGRDRINVGQFASGGYTGSGGKFEPAGTVHRGEFVMTKEATSRIGVSNLYSMMRGSKNASSAPRSNGYAGGGLVSGGMPGVMQLSPYDRALLRNLQPVVNIGNARVSAAANAGDRNNSNRGSN